METPASRSMIHGLSFPTDLLFNLDAVRKHCTIGLTTHQACLAMLKGRIQLEQYYAAELARLADQFKVDADPSNGDAEGSSPRGSPSSGERAASTLHEALSRLKAQYMNTSVQHKALAANLDDEVYRPMDTLYKTLAKKESKLTVCTSRVRKQTKAFEDHYRKQHAKFDKHFREAAVTYAQAMDVGIAPEIIHYQYVSSPVHDVVKAADTTTNKGPAPDATIEVTGPATAHITISDIKIRHRSNSMTSLGSAGASRGGLDGAKLVSWLLPSEQQKKDNLLLQSVKCIENAEVARRECRHAWLGFEEARIALFRSIQSILNDYQQMAEYKIANLTTSLRKHVIFESASLANGQYDWQMLAGVMEAVDADADLRHFILHHQRLVHPDMTVNDLCRSETLPLPPLAKAVEMTDITARRFPVDTRGNPTAVFGWLATRPPPSSSSGVDDDTSLPLVASSVTSQALLAALELHVDVLDAHGATEKPEGVADDGKDRSDDANGRQSNDDADPTTVPPTTHATIGLEDQC
ncbi:Aste57867_14774 [Aphanomyces stellatus]|uniref:Aste57867_14774 protein n=1 Tax=Aphanomyces stellatus TaxID=120398 RepID=A0A485L1J4_9STRA|nr:hypothetical protein As57867_014719 [Aphanomyces stellatus]VFT91592.1 Aste57867_14774 [Aphanomyces stellatus]